MEFLQTQSSRVCVCVRVRALRGLLVDTSSHDTLSHGSLSFRRLIACATERGKALRGPLLLGLGTRG